MTLPSSGAISLADLRGEFGGSAPDSLSEYYRGGGLVPDSATNAGVPTSGAISLSDFYNASAVGYNVLTGSYEDINPISGGAQLTLTYSSSGALTLVGDVGGTLFSGSWKSGGAPAGEYLRVDVTSGGFTSGSTGSDIILTSTRTYTIAVGGTGDLSVTATFTIKNSFGGSTLATGSITLRAASA